MPVYLIVPGAINFFNCCCCGENKDRRQTENEAANPLQSLVKLFSFAWFDCGNAWIYKNYEPNYTDPGSPAFCNKSLYLFVFWVTTAYYIIYGKVVIGVCLAMIWMAMHFGRESFERKPGNFSRKVFV